MQGGGASRGAQLVLECAALLCWPVLCAFPTATATSTATTTTTATASTTTLTTTTMTRTYSPFECPTPCTNNVTLPCQDTLGARGSGGEAYKNRCYPPNLNGTCDGLDYDCRVLTTTSTTIAPSKLCTWQCQLGSGVCAMQGLCRGYASEEDELCPNGYERCEDMTSSTTTTTLTTTTSTSSVSVRVKLLHQFIPLYFARTVFVEHVIDPCTVHQPFQVTHLESAFQFHCGQRTI